MIVQFQDERQAKLFNSEKSLRREFGSDVACRVMERLVQLQSADCLADMWHLPGKWHPLKEDRKGQVACHLTANFRLIVAPADDPVPVLAKGGLDWRNVVAVRVVEVVDYH